MKYNLKNRPKNSNQRSIFKYVEESEEWLVGFEKELRDKLRATYGLMGPEIHIQEKLLREILGE